MLEVARGCAWDEVRLDCGSCTATKGKSQFRENECDCRARWQKAALAEDLGTEDKSASGELEVPGKRRVR